MSAKCEDGLKFTVQCRVMMGEDISRRHGGNRTIVTADRREKRRREKDEEGEEQKNGEKRKWENSWNDKRVMGELG